MNVPLLDLKAQYATLREEMLPVIEEVLASQFFINGPAVNAFTSDLSFEVLPLESVNIPLCQFYKIGCRCLPGKSGTIHAIAFPAVAGNLGGSIA